MLLHQQHPNPGVGDDPPNSSFNILNDIGLNTLGGLVQQQQLWFSEQGTGNSQLLLLISNNNWLLPVPCSENQSCCCWTSPPRVFSPISFRILKLLFGGSSPTPGLGCCWWSNISFRSPGGALLRHATGRDCRQWVNQRTQSGGCRPILERLELRFEGCYWVSSTGPE